MKSLKKSVSILACMADGQGPMTLSELAQSLDLNKPTCHRLLQSLKETGLVQQDNASRKYWLGPKLISLGMAALGSLNLRKIALPQMTRLREKTGETVNLSILDGKDILFIERVQSEHLVNVHLSVGSRLPVHCTSQGKVLLSFLKEESFEALAGTLDLEPRTGRTLTTIESLRRQRGEIRTRGYALNDEELEKGLRAIAGPVFDHTGEVIAAINVSYAVARHPDGSEIEPFASLVCAACRQISHALGHSDTASVPPPSGTTSATNLPELLKSARPPRPAIPKESEKAESGNRIGKPGHGCAL